MCNTTWNNGILLGTAVSGGQTAVIIFLSDIQQHTLHIVAESSDQSAGFESELYGEDLRLWGGYSMDGLND